MFSPVAWLIKKLSSISDFFETPTRRLTVLHSCQCIKKMLLPKFVHNNEVEEVKKF